MACDAAGAEFLLAFVPTKYHALAPSCNFPVGSEAASWTSSDLLARLASWCSESDIHVLDFTPVLQARADKT